MSKHCILDRVPIVDVKSSCVYYIYVQLYTHTVYMYSLYLQYFVSRIFNFIYHIRHIDVA